MTTKPRHHVFLTLDGLRGVAALAVVAGHYADFFGGNPLPGAHLAVDLFFIMSGFVVAYSYEQRLLHGLSMRNFAIIRTVRLAPLYWLGTGFAVVAIAAALLSGTPFALWTWSNLAVASSGALPLFPAVLAGSTKLFPLNIPAWSLAYELLVNALYARTVRRMSRVPLCAIAALGLCGLGYYAGCRQRLDGGGDTADIAQALARVAFGFPVGVLLARAHARRSLPRLAVSPMLLYTAAIGLMWPGARLGRCESLFDLAAIAIACPMIVAAAIGIEPRSRTGAAWLGRISYPLYITHVPIAMVVVGIVRKVLHLDLAALGPAGGIAMMVLVAGSADLLDRYYDRPVRRWATARWLSGTSAQGGLARRG